MAFLRLLLVLILTALLIAGCIRRFSSQSYNTPEALVEGYMLAVRDGDNEGLLLLVSPDHDASGVVNQKIREYENVDFDNMQVDYIPTESSYYWTIRLKAPLLAAHLELTDELLLQKRNDRWFLVLGKMR
jgi:hypothetical protein